MISESKVILLPLKGIFLWATLPKVPRYGMMADNSSLSWNHAPFYSAWNCAYQLESSFSVSLLPSGCMFRVLAREMFNISFRELIVSCSIFKKIDSYRVSSVVIMLDEDPESKDDKINLKQWVNIFDEGIGSRRLCWLLCPLFLLPNAWISGRDSCLVGASCHIPSFW